ncbi:MAG: site-2 protease family protein [Christensenellaceae bacterium]|nr:site-2 protease family protein [Christensenellaceae bacterium]
MRDISIEYSPLLLLLLVWMAISGGLSDCLIALLALSLHEAAHTVMAGALGQRVQRIELQPFGFVARMQGLSAGWWDTLAIAAAGPVCSLMTALTCLTVRGGGEYLFLERFGAANFSIGLINLLPALPLDGGRVLYAALERCISDQAALRIGIALGVLTALALTALGVLLLLYGGINPTLLIFGVFLFVAALREGKRGQEARLNAMLRRHNDIRQGGCVAVAHIGAHKGMRVADALTRLQAGRYTVIQILDDDMRSLGQADEARLLALLAEYGPGARLLDAIRGH